MNCVAHPDREGIAQCQKCSASMCDRCVEHAPDRWPGSCADCKLKEKPASPPPLPETRLPPLPSSWIFRMVALIVLSGPPLLGLALVDVNRPARPYPCPGLLCEDRYIPPNPAQMGAGIAEAMMLMLLAGLLIWNLIGVGLFIGRLGFARFVLVPFYALVLAGCGWVLSHRFDAGFLVPALFSGALLAYFLFSRELKTALAR